MQDPVYSEIMDRPRPGIFATSGLTLLAAAGLWVSALATFAFGAETGLAAVNLAYYLPFVLVPAAVYLLRRPETRAAARLNPLPLVPTLAVILLGLLSVYAASALAALWQLLTDALGLPAIGEAPVIRNPRELTLAIVIMAALPAACEELLFRGLVMPAWESRGTYFAIGVSGAMFALLHGNITGLPAYLLVGAVSGYLVFALDTLYAGIVYHTVYNAACLVIPYLASNQTQPETAPEAALLASMLWQTLLVFGMMAMLLVSLRSRARQENRIVIPRIRRPVEGRDRIMLLAAVLAMAASTVVVAALSMRMGGSA